MSCPKDSSQHAFPIDRHAEIMTNILAWAKSDENIRAIIVNGSSTRPAGASDRFSDRDVQIIAVNRGPLIADDAWIKAIAPIWVALYLDNDDGFDSRLVFFEKARKVDFTIADRSQLDAMSESGKLDSLYAKGYTVLLDKDGITANLPAVTPLEPHTSRPTATEFVQTVDEFWFEAAHMPTYLFRDELWVVKFRDWTMKEMMLRMLEWHAAVNNDERVDVWYIGSKLKHWIEPEVWNDLMGIFGRFDRADSFRALVAMMDVFARLTHDVAEGCGFEVPESEHFIRNYVLGFADEIADN